MAEENHDILETLIKGAGITAFGMFASKLLAYLYRTLIARLVGPDAYGQISIGLMIVSLGSTFATLALGVAIQNFLPKYREKSKDAYINGLVNSSFRLSVLLSLILTGGLFIFSGRIASLGFGNPSLKPIIQIFSLAIPFSVMTGLSLDVTRAFKVARYQVYIRQIGQNIVQLLASIALIIASYGVFGAALGWFMGAVVGSIASIYIMENKFGPFLTSRKTGVTQYRKIFNYSYPLVMAGAIGSLLGWTDTFFIGYYLPETEVGLYNAALPTAMLMMIPYSALSSLVIPSMSEVVERDDRNLNDLLKTLTRWTFSITFPMFCLMALFSDQVIHILFGAEYTAASLSLTILAFGYLYSTSVGHLDSVIQAIEQTNILHKNAVINFVINIGLNILLIPLYGIVGAALATTGSIIFSQTLLLAEVYHFRRILPFSIEASKPVFASLTALVPTFLVLKHSFDIVPLWALIPGAILFGTVYLVALHIIGGLKQSERRQILALVTDIKEKYKLETTIRRSKDHG